MKKKELVIKIDHRLLYTFIVLGILVIIGVGVYATSYSDSGAGHPYTEISTCGANQILKMNSGGNSWMCTTETDPTVEDWAKDNAQNIVTYANLTLMRLYKYTNNVGIVSGHSNPRCEFDTSSSTLDFPGTGNDYYTNSNIGTACYDWIVISGSNAQYTYP